MRNKTNVFVCYTVMHIYISILKVWSKPKQDNILVITDHIHDFENLSKIIKKQNIFTGVFIIKDKELANYFSGNIFNFILFKRNLLKIFEKKTDVKRLIQGLEKEDKVYTFLDQTRTSQYFMLKYGNITLIEDGLSLYTEKTKTIKEIVKRYLIGIPKSFGFDNRIKTVEATHPEKLPQKIKCKSKLLDMEFLTNRLTNQDKDILINIFLGKHVKFGSEKSVLLLTGPYSEEHIITEKYKMDLYRKILEPFHKDYYIYIKPHPREITNYQNLLSGNLMVLEKNFPIELLNIILDIPFEKCITIDSSALKNLKCVKEKVLLGLEYDDTLSKQYYKKYKIIKN